MIPLEAAVRRFGEGPFQAWRVVCQMASPVRRVIAIMKPDHMGVNEFPSGFKRRDQEGVS
jgi:hypothetical protein